MSEFEQFWNKMHNQLHANDYRDASGRSYDCTLVARWVAKKLSDEGKEPHILSYIERNKNYTPPYRPLEPSPFEGRVQWLVHLVCVAEGLVYDPILDGPEPSETYTTTVFGRQIQPSDADNVLKRG